MLIFTSRVSQTVMKGDDVTITTAQAPAPVSTEDVSHAQVERGRYLTASDRLWLHQFAQALRSQFDFLLAERRADPNLHELSAAVLIQLEDRLVTVRTLVGECANHTWNYLVYEAWIWQTARRVRQLLSRVDFLEARAIETYARSIGYVDPDAGDMLQALEAARDALEGPVTIQP